MSTIHEFMFWDADPLQGVAPGAVTADAVTMWEVSKEAEVTQHPIESGSVIADHVIHRPDELTIEFAQSEIPFDDMGGSELEWKKLDAPVEASRFEPEGLLFLTMGASRLIGAGLDALGLGSGSNVTVWTLSAKEEKNRPLEVYDAIASVIDKGQTVSFTRKGQQLDGYVLTSLSMRRVGGHESGLARITVKARKVATVETAASTLLGGFPVPSVLRALPLMSLGKKGTKKIEADVQEHASTALGIGSLGEYL